MANKRTEITTEFKADISGLKQGISQAQRQIKLANAEFKSATAGMDDWEKSTEGVSAKLKQLHTVLGQQNKILEKQQEQLRLVEQEYGADSKAADELRIKIENQKAAIAKTNKDIEKYRGKLDELDTGLQEASNESENLTKATNDAGQEMVSFGDIVKANVAADILVEGLKAMVSMFAEAAKAAVEVGSAFEKSMSEVAAISGATGDDLKMLNETAKQFGESTMFSASEAAQALKYMSLAGWDAQQSSEALGGVLDLAAASGMELAEASDVVTDYLSAFGLEAKESTRLADLMAYAQGNANTSAQQLAEAYQNSAATLKASGQDVETVTALLAAMADQGLKGSEAGTALSAVMRDITQKMKDGAISIGETSVAVMDSEGNFRDLTDIMADVEEATSGMGDAQKQAALYSTFTARSIKGVSLILNKGADATRDFENELRNSAGTASEMASVMQDNLQGQITQMNSALEALGITAYEAFDSELKGGVEEATKAIRRLNDSAKSGKLSVSLRKMSDALGDLIAKGADIAVDVLPKVIDGVTWCIDNFDKLSAIITGMVTASLTMKAIPVVMQGAQIATQLFTVATQGAEVAQTGLNTAMNLNPVGLLVTGMTALTAGLMAYMATADFSIDRTAALNAEQKELVETAHSVAESVRDSAGSRKEEIENLDAQAVSAKSLVTELKKYVDENGKVIAEQERAKAIVDELNAVMPELNLRYDEQAQALSMTTAELEKNVDALWAQAKATAMEEQMTDVLKERFRVEAEMQKMDAEYKKAQDDLVAANQRRKDAEEKLNIALESGASNAREVAAAAQEEQLAYEDTVAATKPVIQAYTDLEGELGNLQSEQDYLNGLLEETEFYTSQASGAVDGYAQTVAEDTSSISESWQTLHDAVADSVGSQISLFEAYKGAAEISREEVLANMQSQVDAMTNWSSNLQELAKMGISEGLLAELSKLGMDGAQYVAAFVKMSDDELKKANEMFEKSATIPESTATAVATNYETFGRQAYTEGLNTGITEGAEISKETIVQKSTEVGMEGSEAVGDGIDKKSNVPVGSAKKMANQTAQEINKDLNASKTKPAGQSADAGVADGINDNMGQPVGAAEALGSNVTATIDAGIKAETFIPIGQRVGAGIASGIRSSIDEIRKAAQEASQAAQSGASGKNTSDTKGKLTGKGSTSANDLSAQLNSALGVVKIDFAEIGGLQDTVRKIDTSGTVVTEQSQTINNNYTFEQTNNSPKALSRLDIYRQTRNQFAMLKGV